MKRLEKNKFKSLIPILLLLFIFRAYTSDDMNWVNCEPNKKLQAIRKINEMHDRLCDGITLFRDTFLLQILFSIAASFIFSVFALFSTYR